MVALVLVFFAVAVHLGGYFLFKKRTPFCENYDKFQKKTIVSLVINLVVVALCALCVDVFTASNGVCLIVAGVLTTLSIFFGITMSGFIKNIKLSKFLKSCAVVCTAVILLEVFFFNCNSFSLSKNELTPITTSTVNADTISLRGNSATVTGDGSISIDVNQNDFNCVSVYYNNNIAGFSCSATVRDGNRELKDVPVGVVENIVNNEGQVDIAFDSYETLTNVTLSFYDVGSVVVINKIALTSAAPFNFSYLRFFAIVLVSLIISAVYCFELYKIVYNRKSFKHNAVIFVLLFVMLLSSLLFINPDEGMIDYHSANIPTSDPYVQMFDATQKGQLNIDIPVTDDLMNMENPYDWDQRNETGVYYAWDRAYYDGQYYSYFGIVPVFVVYYPFYFITGNLPNLNIMTWFFSALAIVSLFGVIMAITKAFIKKPNFLMLLTVLFSSVFCSGIYYALNFSDIYFPAKISGISFMFITVWLGISACLSKKRKTQIVLFCLSAIAFVLSVGCRPTAALGALLLAPIFISFLADKKYILKHKIICVSSFILPIIIGAGVLMWYNYARFDSFFEFGTSYQLTVSNISANSMRLSDLPNAIIHYIFHPFKFSPEFPFFEVQQASINNYGHYMYSDNFFGMINFPCLMLGLFISIYFVLRNAKKERRLKKGDNVKYFTYLSLVLIALFAVWTDYCLAGVVFGYTLDIMPVLTMIYALVFLDLSEQSEKIPQVKNKVVAVLCGFMVVTSLIIFLQLLTYDSGNLCALHPNLKYTIENAVVFWR